MKPETLAIALYRRFPQSPSINEFIMKHGCPHWYFDIPCNPDCWACTCAECWNRPAPVDPRIK